MNRPTSTEQVVTQSAARIERIIRRDAHGHVAEADFNVLLPEIGGRRWLACRAISFGGNHPMIWVDGMHINPEHTAALIIALQMAVEWIAEESGNRGAL